RRHTRSKRDWSSDVCSSDLRISRKVFYVSNTYENRHVSLRTHDDVEEHPGGCHHFAGSHPRCDSRSGVAGRCTRSTPAQNQQTFWSYHPADSRGQSDSCRCGLCFCHPAFGPAGRRNSGGSTSSLTGSADQPPRTEPTVVGRTYHHGRWHVPRRIAVDPQRRCCRPEAYWTNRSRGNDGCRCTARLTNRCTARHR